VKDMWSSISGRSPNIAIFAARKHQSKCQRATFDAGEPTFVLQAETSPSTKLYA
jgi:hypothetical protein